jgi:hypothetical protein
MGWWSTDVLGGDPPLDMLGVIEDQLGVSDLYPLAALSEAQRTELVAVLDPRTVDALVVELAGAAGDNGIGLQVLAAVVMAAGAAMGETLREAALRAARDDEWASEDEERRESMDDLAKAAREYQDGEPVVLAHTGLFEKIRQATRLT